MGVGWQEIVALLIVALVVGFAVYRRWHRGRSGGAADPASNGSKSGPTEAPLRFYRKRR